MEKSDDQPAVAATLVTNCTPLIQPVHMRAAEQ